MNAREIIERERRELSLPECEHGWVDQEFLSPVVYDTCPHCRIKELSAAAERAIERLQAEWKTMEMNWITVGKENERLRALLRDIAEDADVVLTYDLHKRISAVIAEVRP